MEKFNTAWLSLTYNCNNKCIWCYANSNNITENKTLNPKFENGVVKLLSDLNLKKIILIGGEPTLYKNLPNLISKFNSKNIPVGMVTNGRKLKDYHYLKELKEAGLQGFSISIEGHNSTSHDSITMSKGSYNETIQGIENAKRLGLPFSTNTVICKENVSNLEKIVDSLEDKTKSITFNFCGDCINEEANNKLIIHPYETAKAFQNIYNYSKEKGLSIKLVTPMPFCIFDKDYINKFKEEGIIQGGPCQLTSGKNFVLEYNGNIAPCTHFTDFSLLNVIENNEIISYKKFNEIYWNKNGIPEKFRNLMNRYPSEKCTDDCNEPCSGGCPLIYKLFSPNDIIK